MTKEMKFEEMMKKLEEIVADLESGEMSLDESLEKYEEGVKLLRLCRKRLDETKRKVEILVKKGGKLSAEPFEEEDTKT
jgi:exodeoxyribonuclease VII small subunit